MGALSLIQDHLAKDPQAVPDALHQCGGSSQTQRSLLQFSPSDAALRSPICTCWAALLALAVAPFFATPLSSAAFEVTPDQTNPNSFVREVLQHEYDAQLRDKALWSYSETKKEDGKTKLYSVYQTHQGEIDRLIAVNGHPLGSTEAQAEDARINKLIHHSNEMHSEQHKRAEDDEHARNLLKMFPDAFLYQYDGKEGELVRLKFVPNPKFHAEGHAAQVFHHLEGTILLDAIHQRLIAISGRLTSEVKFGYGLLGYLAPGGTFDVKQKEVSPGYWEVTRMRVEMYGKALFFKTIGAHDDESYTDFHRVPDTTSLEQAAALVRRSPTGD
jgi:hypothetical protein